MGLRPLGHWEWFHTHVTVIKYRTFPIGTAQRNDEEEATEGEGKWFM
jgi:hypothetical protein